VARGLGINPSLKVDRALDSHPIADSGAAASAAGPGHIEKQARGGASEVAENEYRKAMADVRRGATGDGIAGLRRALLSEPRFNVARQALLSLLVEGQQWADAQTVCSEGLALDPRQSSWAMLLARLQLERGDQAGAAATLAQYAGGADRNADYQAFHALLLNRLQKPKEAAERYRAAVALRPTEGRWWYGLGMALEADQRPDESRQAFQKAREAGNLPADLASAVEQKLR
jgi:MSHA biogenesis protein MshN